MRSKLNVEELENRLVPSTLTVTTLLDSGAGSFRDAVAQSAAGDTINFSVSGTILFGSQIDVNNSLTINAQGITFDGQGNTQLLVLDEANPQTGDVVVINDAVFQHGSTNVGEDALGGGALEVQHLGASLARCTFLDNFCNAYGGAISIYDAALTASACTFTNNTTNGSGGAIYAWDQALANVNVDSSTFTGNTAVTRGGSIDEECWQASENKTFAATNSTFDTSQATAIFTSPNVSSVNVTGSTFAGSSGTGGGGGGGSGGGGGGSTGGGNTTGLGVSVAANGQITYTVTSLADGTDATPGTLRQAISLINNAPETTAALETIVDIPAGTILLNGQLEISHNAMFCGAGENLTILDSQGLNRQWFVYFHSAADGEPDSDPNPLADNVTFEDMTMQGADGSHTGDGGGAIHDRITPMCVERVCFMNDHAQIGGGIADENAPIMVENCEFENCTATQSGGAIYLYGDSACNGSSISGTSFLNCTAAISGGAIYENTYAPVELVNGVWQNVPAYPMTLTITNCTFTGNTAPQGGALWTEHFIALTLTGDSFTTSTDTIGVF